MTQAMLNPQLFLEGTLVREPVGAGEGYWIGGPGVFLDPADSARYLTYRIRRPRGVEPDRGGIARIARSTDGVHFDDIWETHKNAYHTTSIERSAIRRGPDGAWRYYTSFVDPADGRWCTEMIRADAPDAFETADRQRLFTASAFGLEGVKDPFILEHEGVYHMFLSVALPTERTGESAHATHDIYNTGQCLSATALATSSDLDHWQWQGVVFQPEPGGIGERWDGYCRRINSVLPVGSGFLAFFDGSKGHEQNYEECTGLATSTDLRTWRSLNADGPAVLSPHASGSIRYVDALPIGDDVHLYYECTRPDGAHELRVAQVKASDLPTA